MRTARSCAAALLVASLLLACSSSSSSPTPCNQDPYTCAAGKTCWAADTAGNFSCLTSGAGKKGDKCLNTPGTPTCSDRLACLQLSAAGGTCVSYCDPSRQGEGCDTGETCQLAGVQGTNQTFHICVGSSATPPADAGTD